MKIKCIIVDDEPAAHEVLKTYIGRLDYLEFVGQAFDALDATLLLKTKEVDVMFLDINMPEITGLEFISTLQNPPKTILTTAYSEFALDAFDLGVVDYLLKPIPFIRFMKAIDKLTFNQNTNEETSNKEPAQLSFKVDGIPKEFESNDIYFFQAYGNYIKIHTKEKVYLTILTLSELEKYLSNSQFIRIHKSYILPKKMLSNIENGKILLKNVEIPVGRSYKQAIKNLILSMS